MRRPSPCGSAHHCYPRCAAHLRQRGLHTVGERSGEARSPPGSLLAQHAGQASRLSRGVEGLGKCDAVLSAGGRVCVCMWVVLLRFFLRLFSCPNQACFSSPIGFCSAPLLSPSSHLLQATSEECLFYLTGTASEKGKWWLWWGFDMYETRTHRDFCYWASLALSLFVRNILPRQAQTDALLYSGTSAGPKLQ